MFYLTLSSKLQVWSVHCNIFFQCWFWEFESASRQYRQVGAVLFIYFFFILVTVCFTRSAKNLEHLYTQEIFPKHKLAREILLPKIEGPFKLLDVWWQSLIKSRFSCANHYGYFSQINDSMFWSSFVNNNIHERYFMHATSKIFIKFFFLATELVLFT